MTASSGEPSSVRRWGLPNLSRAGAFRSELGAYMHIPLKINMEPENHPFGQEIHLPNIHFGVPCSFWECIYDKVAKGAVKFKFPTLAQSKQLMFVESSGVTMSLQKSRKKNFPKN